MIVWIMFEHSTRLNDKLIIYKTITTYIVNIQLSCKIGIDIGTHLRKHN